MSSTNKLNFENFLSNIPHKFNTEDTQLLRKAFDTSVLAHTGQKRKSGEDFVTHPIEAAIILGKIFPNTEGIAATLLHDITEDTDTSEEYIRQTFGETISHLVSGVTKLGKVRLRNSKEPLYMENLRKMFLATSGDIRVILIKLADRLHNMRTLSYLPKEKAGRIAAETLEIFAPIASRLGIGLWKDELEDLSFASTNEEAFNNTKKILEAETSARKYSIKKLEKEIVHILKQEGVKFIEVKGRVKRIYSLNKKLEKYHDDISKIYDIFALRIITKSTVDCYSVVGIIHKHFQPLPGRIKDYIATPKPNGYRSLHTTVFDADSKVFEIQIRTESMDEEAERGIAAHWFYSENDKESEHFQNKASWIKELHSWRDLVDSDEEYYENLKIDFFQDRIFVLTPKGDVKDLPKNASVIDFAFAVHSDLGLYMMGAKVNGKIKSIYNELKQGDVVEILKSKKPVTISRDWLKSTRTSLARHQIRQYLAKNDNGIMKRVRELKLENMGLPTFFRKK